MEAQASLRDTILSQIGSFLHDEGFQSQQFIKEGIFEIINLISDYQEEGRVLFPEVLITNDLGLLKTIPDFKVKIGEQGIAIESYKKIIKYCAPLCTSEWIIYIEVKDGRLKYGLTCAELTETTPSLYKQSVGEMKLDITGCNVAYIHNIGKKTVRVIGLRNSITVSLSLNDITEISINEIGTLASHICEDVQLKKEVARNFIEKILSDGFKEGHGNLIGVVSNSAESITNLRSHFPEGIYLPEPIDLLALLLAFEVEKSAENSVALRQHATIVKSMCNNDGIAIFTTDGKLMAYHIIINKDFIPDEVKKTISGGARTQAFFNMKYSNAFQFGLIKSQDGPIKIFKKA
ncbi:MAG: hypothetical protein HOP37_14320 [Cyclobacteriaceae bacterium]|nr:hypothetical protein [Cyclobacteriaceae bacterium]